MMEQHRERYPRISSDEEGIAAHLCAREVLFVFLFRVQPTAALAKRNSKKEKISLSTLLSAPHPN